MSKINENAALKIIELLDERKITQKALAEHLGIQPNTISGWLSGKHKISLENVYKIAKFLNVSVDYILGLQTAKTQDKDLSFVCKYLGINEQAVQEIKRLAADERYCHLINDICIPNTENKTEFIKRKCTSKLHVILRLVVEELLERELQISTAERIMETTHYSVEDVNKIKKRLKLTGEKAEQLEKGLLTTTEDEEKYANLISKFWDSDDKIRINTYRIQETFKDFLHEYYNELILKTDDLKKLDGGNNRH